MQIFHRNNAQKLRAESIARNACAYGQRVAAPTFVFGAARERPIVGTIEVVRDRVKRVKVNGRMVRRVRF